MPAERLPESRKHIDNLLKAEAADVVFGNQWKARGEGIVKQWLDDLKDWENIETFERAFLDDRMTIRGIGKPTSATDDSWKGGKIDTFPTKNVALPKGMGTLRSANVSLYKGMEGLNQRLKPANFAGAKIKDLKAKYALGLHDLSASLLTHTRVISDQFKPYENAIWVFMPIPQQEDLKTFFGLNQQSKLPGSSPEFRQYVRLLASQITRVKFAQACDMHTTYLDIGGLNYYSPPKQGLHIRYGMTGSKLVRRDCEVVLHKKKNQFDEPWKTRTGQPPRTMYVVKSHNSDSLLFRVVEGAQTVMFEKTEAEALIAMNVIRKDESQEDRALRIAETSGALRKLKDLLGQATPDSPLSENAKEDAVNWAARVSGYNIWSQQAITTADVQTRRDHALEYKSILSSAWNNRGRGANEIVMAYREHGTSKRVMAFPMYAERDATDGTFSVIDNTYNKTGATIADNGTYSPA